MEQDIFEKLAMNNDFDEFSTPSIKATNQNPTEFSEIQNLYIHKEEESGDIFDQISTKKKESDKNKFGFLDTLRDIGEQIVSKGVSGALGAYGNILPQLKEGQKLQGQETRHAMQEAVLEKLQRGEVPSAGELSLLSEEDILPESSRLPTSADVQKGIESTTGIGQGKTPAGRIAGRGAQFAGEGLAFPGGGIKSLATLGASGLAGQGIREADLPEALATATEIGGTIVPSIIQGRLNPKKGPAKELTEAGRKVGLSETQITPLIQGENKATTLSKIARKGGKTKELFASIKESLGDSYQNIRKEVSKAPRLSVKNEDKLIDKFVEIRNDLQKTLKASPDKQAAIDFIQESIDKIHKQGAHPEELVNFWQDINKSVKWNSIQGGKKELARLKEPILEVLQDISPTAAKDFELTNQLYSKYAQISKKLKPDMIDAIINKGELLALVPGGLALAQGNPWILAGLASENAMRLMAREMLISPYFQNLGRKLVTNFNGSSMKGVSELVNQAKARLEKKYPEEDWGFLTED